MESRFRLPGHDEPEIVVERSALGGIKVTAGGAAVPRRRGRQAVYEVPLADGTTVPIELKGQYTGLRAVVAGMEIPIERPIPKWLLVLVFLPLALVLGGLVGGVLGIIGTTLNGTLARSGVPAAAKAGGMLVTTVVAAAIWYGVAFVVTPLPKLDVGACMNGIREGSVVTATSNQPVDCAQPHDNEVIGSFDYTASSGFPGSDALQAFAEQVCLPAFSQYVGVDFQSSKLDVLPLLPTDQTWLKGDRTVSCIVLMHDGTKLTGSVKGTAQ